ncbi:MAG: type II toxin-antitoxin system VapC family toxin [Nanoarchaeota archaeon]
MSKLIYIDTNVYMDYFLGRKDRFLPLDEFAATVFERARSCEFDILVSDWVLHELMKQDLSAEAARFFERFRAIRKIHDVVADTADHAWARVQPTHFSDAVHAALAIRHGASCIVTSNIKDFSVFTNRIRCVSPRVL